MSLALTEQLAIEVAGLTDTTERIFQMADEILRDFISGDRSLRFDEKTFFKARCGWDDSEITRQSNRMRQVLRHQNTSGSLLQRESAYDEAEKCQELLENEGPKLDAKIAALQEQRSTLGRNANRSQKRCEEIDAAVAELRTLVRPDIQSQYDQHLENIAEDFREVQVLKVEIGFRQNLLGDVPSDFNDRQRFMELVRAAYPDCVRPNQHKPGHHELVEPNWTLRKVVLTKELNEMRVKLDELIMIRDKEMASVNELLDFYVLK